MAALVEPRIDLFSHYGPLYRRWRMKSRPCSALPGGMPALLSDLVEPVEETPILEGCKDGKGTAHHAAISSPTSSRESFQIALEDHGIKRARITWFDPKQAEASSKKVANIGGNGSQTWIGPVNGNQLMVSIPLRGCKEVPAPGIQVTEGLREPLKHVEQGIVILPQSQEAGSDGKRKGSTKPWVLPGGRIVNDLPHPAIVIEETTRRASPHQPGIGGKRSSSQISSIHLSEALGCSRTLLQRPAWPIDFLHIFQPEPHRRVRVFHDAIAAWSPHSAWQIIKQV